LSPRSGIPFLDIEENLLLDYSYVGEVGNIASLMTQRTRYRNKILINLRPRPGYLTILLIDTKVDATNLPHNVAAFLDAIRFQCASLPIEETVACDSRFIDSIDTPAGLMIEGDTAPQPSLTLSWIIGHEIGHVVLRHGSGAYGWFDPVEPAQKPLQTDLTSGAEPKNAKCAQVDEADQNHLNALFYLESAADSFALDRIHPNETMNVLDFHHGNWYMELAQQAIDAKSPRPAQAQTPEQEQTEPSPRPSVTIELPLDLNHHPPMLWRLHHFLTQAQNTYRNFKVPALGFEPDLIFCFHPQKAVREAQHYYQNGFYIHGPVDDKGTRLLGQLLDDELMFNAVGGTAKYKPSKFHDELSNFLRGTDDEAIVQPDFCVNAASRKDGEPLAAIFQNACFAVILTHFIEERRCPPNIYLERLFDYDGPLYQDIKKRSVEYSHALATLTGLIGPSCLSQQGVERTYAATLNALQVLSQNGATGTSNLLFGNLVNLIDGLDTTNLPKNVPSENKEKFLVGTKLDLLGEIRGFARKQLWFAEVAAIYDKMIVIAAGNSDFVPMTFELNLRREKALVELENGLVPREIGIENVEAVFDSILAAIDTKRLDDDPAGKQYIAYETANHALFFLVLDGSCKAGLTWAEKAFSELKARFDTDAAPPEKLISTWVASANCAGADLSNETIERARKSAETRLASAHASQDAVAAEDALRGLIAISIYRYIHNDIEQAQKDMQVVVRESSIDSEKTETAKLLNFCSPAMGRCIDLKDVARGLPFDVNRYKPMPQADPSISWTEVGGK
jgi:hypothetical protein